MGKTTIDRLIINSPYVRPTKYWSYDRSTRLFDERDGRRPAGYVIASEQSKAFDDPGIFVELPLVNQIRGRVDVWRAAEYPGITGISRRLLQHWQDASEREDNRFFFCQLEAIETLIWLNEADPSERQGIGIPGDGGPFLRLCSKMATGSGKTVVMAMLIAYHILNKVTAPLDRRFSKNVLVVAPGLTVKNRLQVLHIDSPGNYYDQFNVVPMGLREKLRLGRVIVKNWHKLEWQTEEQIARKKTVDKRGALSDEAYVRDVLGDMANAANLLVINDEAHHSWRIPAESKVKGVTKADIEEATKWIGGLDRIHRSRGILRCHDFSATPFAPSGKKTTEEALFGWIVSDFGLNDAIESGLVKTPRVVVRDDGILGSDFRSRLYHIYNDPEVKNDLNRKAEEYVPLPDLVMNAYDLLGSDWLETAKAWEQLHFPTPPVMITVGNRTETAARVQYAFEHKRVHVDELTVPDRILHIDTKVLEMAEAMDEAAPMVSEQTEDEEEEPAKRPLTKQEQAELLRRTVDTVGRPGQPGEMIQKVISVGMLSEGWDAKTVTHIMGLRAFSSQLLCEQVVGRGLRRTSYEVNPETGLFDPEYVNIFGVPFTFLPHEGEEGPPPPPPPPKIAIEPVKEKQEYEVRFPNVLRIEHIFRPKLVLDMTAVSPLKLDAFDVTTAADVAPILEGKPDLTRLSEIDLEDLGRRYRLQRITFEAARDVYDQMKPTWTGNKEFLLAQLIGLVEGFLKSKRIEISPPLFYQEPLRRRILLTLSMTKIVQHIFEAVRFQNTEEITPVFDKEQPIRSTGDMRTWYTGRPCEYTKRSHINHCVFESTWEASEAFLLDKSKNVEAWVKNDHLGFEILYVFGGVVQKYRPDFLVRLKNGKMLVLEVKGQDSQRDQTKRRFLDEWVQAVNGHGGFGQWASAVSYSPPDLRDILEKNGSRS